MFWNLLAVSLVFFVLIIAACSPIVSTTSLVHSIVKGDAFGTATGIIGQIISTVTPEEHPPKQKSKAEIMEDLRNAMN